MYDKAHIKRVLMERDGLDAEEATERIVEAQREADAIIESGDYSIFDFDRIVEDHFGLEPDFALDFYPM
jgi:hypothetical protein